MIEIFKIGYNRSDPKATKDMFESNNRDTWTNEKKSDNGEGQIRIAEKLFYH